MSHINEVRQILMNELGLTRESIREEAGKIIREAIAQHIKNMGHQGVILGMVEDEFRAIVKGRGSEYHDSIKGMCRAAIDASVKKYVDNHLRVQFSGFDEPAKAEVVTAVKTTPFRHLPIGARFKFVDRNDVWCVLQTHGRGLVAIWPGNILQFSGQLICSAEETEAETDELRVILLPDSAQTGE